MVPAAKRGGDEWVQCPGKEIHPGRSGATRQGIGERPGRTDPLDGAHEHAAVDLQWESGGQRDRPEIPEPPAANRLHAGVLLAIGYARYDASTGRRRDHTGEVPSFMSRG